jgi:hypothetical protein
VVITVPVPDPSRDEKPAVTEDVPAAVEKGPDTPLRRDPDGAWTDVPAAALPPADPPESEKSVKPEPEPAAPPSPPPEPPKAPEPDLPQTTDAAALANGGREPVVSDLPVEHLPEKAPPAAPPELPPEEPAGIPAASAEPPVPPPEEPFAGPEPSGGEYNYTLIPAEERPPAGGSLVAPPAVSPPPVPQIFSVPAVARLEYGKYYLQIGAYSQTAAVERELSKIERGYPLTVQCAGTAAKPVYRILVGPVNQGESGALLRSFKGKGYKDAFVRRGE